MATTTKYDTPFYEGIGPGSEASARRVLPVVLELVQARSAVDVGCGDGSWLQLSFWTSRKAAEEAEAEVFETPEMRDWLAQVDEFADAA